MPNTCDVIYGDRLYRRRKINGYYVLHPYIDGRVDWNNYVYEHRLVYETSNDVKLPQSMHVHHINHCRDDNRPENLAVMTNSEHASLHAIEDGKQIGDRYCIDCGKRIDRSATRCVECARIIRRTKMHPTKEQLSEYIKTMNNSQIARMCGVSGSSVRKWRKAYGLPSYEEQHSKHADIYTVNP